MKNQRYLAFQFVHPDFDSDDGREGLVTDQRDCIGTAHGSASIRQSILMLLSTRPGERVMRPDYGSHLHRLIFAPNDATTAGLAIHYVKRALNRWEPRIDILHLDASASKYQGGQLDISLEYREKASRVQEHLLLTIDIKGQGE
jgi:phage baseplate assembly protein W